MDADRFDTLARFVSIAGSRRRAVATAFGGALGVFGLAHPDEATAARTGKCKPKCGECEKCKKGDCKRKNGKKVCKRGKCQPKVDGTACSRATCQNGRCVCHGLDTPCTADAQCCTGICDSYFDECKAVRFGCDPTIAGHCPDQGICCTTFSSDGEFVCLPEPSDNPRVCGTTCDNLVDCNFGGGGRAAVCRDGACCCPTGAFCPEHEAC
jgi:hypothetical protein